MILRADTLAAGCPTTKTAPKTGTASQPATTYQLLTAALLLGLLDRQVLVEILQLFHVGVAIRIVQAGDHRLLDLFQLARGGDAAAAQRLQIGQARGRVLLL